MSSDATSIIPSTQSVRDENRCKYPYKACFQPRSIKKDGDAHSLCEFHRKKANSIQKIYATKRRQQLRALKKHKILQHKQRTEEPTVYSYDKTDSVAARAQFNEIEMAHIQVMLAPLRRPVKPEVRTTPATTRLYDVKFLLNNC